MITKHFIRPSVLQVLFLPFLQAHQDRPEKNKPCLKGLDTTLIDHSKGNDNSIFRSVFQRILFAFIAPGTQSQTQFFHGHFTANKSEIWEKDFQLLGLLFYRNICWKTNKRGQLKEPSKLVVVSNVFYIILLYSLDSVIKVNTFYSSVNILISAYFVTLFPRQPRITCCSKGSLIKKDAINVSLYNNFSYFTRYKR